MIGIRASYLSQPNKKRKLAFHKLAPFSSLFLLRSSDGKREK